MRFPCLQNPDGNCTAPCRSCNSAYSEIAFSCPKKVRMRHERMRIVSMYVVRDP